jgi:hypothetical protein
MIEIEGTARVDAKAGLGLSDRSLRLYEADPEAL